MNSNKILLTETNFSKLKDEIKKNPDKQIIFLSDSDELNRKVIEKLPIHTLLINQKQRKDKPKQRDSGLNQVLAKAAKKNNVVIGINLDEIIGADKKEKAEILARIKQNIKLCNKNRLNMDFISLKENKRDNYDLKSLGLILGMPTWMASSLKNNY